MPAQAPVRLHVPGAAAIPADTGGCDGRAPEEPRQAARGGRVPGIQGRVLAGARRPAAAPAGGAAGAVPSPRGGAAGHPPGPRRRAAACRGRAACVHRRVRHGAGASGERLRRRGLRAGRRQRPAAAARAVAGGGAAAKRGHGGGTQPPLRHPRVGGRPGARRRRGHAGGAGFAGPAAAGGRGRKAAGRRVGGLGEESAGRWPGRRR
mmetsp:Transcript_39009/g.104548  ORF Transcript_39009/g.104548 Transcript_39009/m.104548 type:complete len:207 (+) Transcript_39009:1-621(+)